MGGPNVKLRMLSTCVWKKRAELRFQWLNTNVHHVYTAVWQRHLIGSRPTSSVLPKRVLHSGLVWKLWKDLTTFNQAWPSLTKLDQTWWLWRNLTEFNQIHPNTSQYHKLSPQACVLVGGLKNTLCHRDLGSLTVGLTQIGQVWPGLTKFDQIWTGMTRLTRFEVSRQQRETTATSTGGYHMVCVGVCVHGGTF